MCEHVADQQVKTTHCHAAIDLKVTKVALEKELKRLSLGGRGQLAILSKTEKEIDGERRDYDYDILCVYILKGCLATKATNNTDHDIEKWVARWVSYPTLSVTETITQAAKVTTQWDVILKTIEESKKNLWWENVIQSDGSMTQSVRIDRRQQIFKLLVQHLNTAKIRTSRNELERIFVTLLRQDERSVEEIYQSISRNIFRT